MIVDMTDSEARAFDDAYDSIKHLPRVEPEQGPMPTWGACEGCGEPYAGVEVRLLLLVGMPHGLVGVVSTRKRLLDLAAQLERSPSAAEAAATGDATAQDSFRIGWLESAVKSAAEQLRIIAEAAK